MSFVDQRIYRMHELPTRHGNGTLGFCQLLGLLVRTKNTPGPGCVVCFNEQESKGAG